MFSKKILFFIEVVRAGSFSAAARNLFLSQSAVSQQVSQLESELGFRLLDRSTYRPTVTEEGKKYYKFCLEAETQYRELVQSLKNARTLGNIRIAFSGTAENKGLIQLTSFFRKYHNGVSFSYIEGTFRENSERLGQGDVDVAFGLECNFRNMPVRVENLYRYRMCVITSFDHPFCRRKEVQPMDLVNQKFVILSRRFGKNFHHDFIASFLADGLVKRQIVKEADTFDELMASVSVGEGIAIVSQNVVDATAVSMTPLSHSHHEAEYVLAFREENASTLLRTFVITAKDYFQRENDIASQTL